MVFWPYHLLYKECPNSRILTWGYDSMISTFFHGSANQNNFFSHARNLLGDLNRERNQCQNRPLIFVAHSLGGIIVKQVKFFGLQNHIDRDHFTHAQQMFLHADESTRQEDQKLSKSIKGVIFLGTPHKGSDTAELAETIRRVVSAAGFDTVKQNLQSLRIDSDSLHECHRRFLLLLKRHNEVDICIFQEARGVTGVSYLGLNKKVVPDISSSIDGIESVFTIDANHMDMCRYPDRTCDGYRKVVGELRTLGEIGGNARKLQSEKGSVKVAKRVLGLAEIEAIDNACLDSLAYQEMNYRQREIEDVHIDSCNWIFRDECYSKWFNEKRGLLWIKGKPGSGKSTLMKKIFKSINNHKCVRLAFFFHRRGNALQQSPIGMFRTMLHQLLTQIPYVEADFINFWEDKKKWEDWEWRFEELRELFSSALLTAAKSHAIVIFVDALDEAGDESAPKIVEYFHELQEQLFELEEVSTSICFSCRHFPVFAVKNAMEICVENENSKDIAKYVHNKLEQILDTHDSRVNPSIIINDLAKNITNRASGIFLWVVLVTPIVARQYNHGKSLNTIQQTLTTIPASLTEIYKHILTEVIDFEDRSRTLQLLLWIYFAERPLSVREMRYAMASDDLSIYPPIESCQESDNFVENDERMSKLVTSLSGGLAEVKKTVQFIHQSVNDFLSRDKFKIFGLSSDSNYPGEGHRLLFTSCLNYIKSNDVLSWMSSVLKIGSRDSQLQKHFEDFPLLRYATFFMFRHASKAEKLGISNLNLPQRVDWPDQKVLRSWIGILHKFREDRDNYQLGYQYMGDRLVFHADNMVSGMTLLHIAAYWNLPRTGEALLKSQVQLDETDDDLNQSLHYAALSNNTQMIQNLLAKGVNINSKNKLNETALIRAAQNDHESAMSLLIKHGANTEIRSTETCSALHYAAKFGCYRAVSILLRAGADINARGGIHGNALQAASYQGHEKIVTMLIENGAYVNARGGQHESALQAASWRFEEEIVQILLENGADVNVQGEERHNALVRASCDQGNENIVRMLIENGADVNAKGGDFENALQAASLFGNEGILKMLIENGADVNAEGGELGSALQVASRHEDAEIVKMLIKHGADVNAQGGNFGNALQAASWYGNERIVKLLIENGADVNAKSGRYGNALEAGREYERIVKLLLDNGAQWTQEE